MTIVVMLIAAILLVLASKHVRPTFTALLLVAIVIFGLAG